MGFIKNTVRECLNENINTITFKKSVDEDTTTLTAYINNKKVGSISMEILFDAYQYEFEDVFDEHTFNKLYPDEKIVKISHIVVDDKYKNSGIGSKLMERGMKLMKKNGYNQFYLNASPMGFKGLGTAALVNFYKKFGFKELLNQGHNVLMGVIFDKKINEDLKNKRKETCNNVLCFSKMLIMRKFTPKYVHSGSVDGDSYFNIRVLIKGDGDELDRTFEIEVPVLKELQKIYGKEYKLYVEDLKNETSVIGWNFYGEQTETREIFYSEIEAVVEDLNR